jgi:hypothetical protein
MADGSSVTRGAPLRRGACATGLALAGGRGLVVAARPPARAHVKAFRERLDSKAIAETRFEFQGVTEDPEAILEAAIAFERLAVEAHKGQAPRLQRKQVLATALVIRTVEATAWMRYLNGITPAASAFDDPRPKEEIDRIVRATGFVRARPHMAAPTSPHFTG